MSGTGSPSPRRTGRPWKKRRRRNVGCRLPSGARQGVNDFGNLGYGGPCPPPGPRHRYVFRLYALDADPEPAAGAAKAELEHAIEGHVLTIAELVGTYER